MTKLTDQADSKNKVRTRFAPSPTGMLHIGSIQKIVYSYAMAKKYGGEYLVRLEDTDRNRFLAEGEADIFETHAALGISPDESITAGGEYGPYRQSDRLEIYNKYILELIEKGSAYYAFETPEELDRMRKVQQQSGSRPKYDGKYRDYPLEDAKKRVANGEKYVVRIKIPNSGQIEFDDMIMGKIKVENENLDDYVLVKSDGYPTYHFAVVVDDHLMEISHIFRGVEWIPTAPIHVLLYDFFGWEKPVFAHIPNILDPKGGKLSKRSGSVAAYDYFSKGYLPQAVMNYMVLQGWNPKTEQEVFTLAEFVEVFKTENFNKSNPVFNPQKLDWFNQQHIRRLSVEDLEKSLLAWIKKYHTDNQEYIVVEFMDSNIRRSIIALEQERVTTFTDLADSFAVIAKSPETYEIDHKQVKNLSPEDYIKVIEAFQVLDDNFENHETWEKGIRGIADGLGMKAGQAFMILRIATTGRVASPPLFEIMQILGVEEVTKRLEDAKTAFKTNGKV